MARKSEQPTTETVIHGGTIRFEEPKGSRAHKHKGTIVIAPPEVHPVSGFLGFLRDYGVVGVAIGFIVGLQAQNLVKQLVDSFINPAFQLFFGQALNTRSFVWHFHGRDAVFSWGGFVYGLLNFLFVLAAIYVLIKLFKLDKLNKPKDK